ncbi:MULTISPECIES: PAAR domain-containing protein [unclassified Serratia (in: enterobacteria)]|uniref:PAAR domain-containing protein n=1 Tax=unclassified Serratia (in: enterobacteria) TaxID=2647522 RepID=UPI0005054353|nr:MULTISPECIES: PAAR domain-containing protein [unclassified Serratia (in: enterobacteria)]KFK91697.1 PAAR repeat protein [Serratia sp. Ag2]KFK92209.1 PAAR repeat protein [Serratia sp. Ag1]
MLGVVCLGDTTTHGGEVKTASSTLYFNGLQAALVGEWVSCPRHGMNTIVEGDSTTFEEGRQVVVNNCLCACGCRVISSQPENSIES